MKIIPIALVPHYEGPGSTLCHCMKLTLRDETIVGATSTDRALVIDDVTYHPWLDVSDLASTSTLGVDNLEVTIVTDDVDLMADLEAGRYDNASFYLFETNYLNPTDGANVLKTGTTGEAQITDSGKYTLEFRGLTQALQQTVGMVTSKTCRANLADYPRQALGAPCRLDPVDFTVTGAVTSLVSNQRFSDSGRTEDDDWFGAGFLKFTSGLNENYERQIATFIANEFVFILPFPFEVQTTDAYSVIAGCRKRHDRSTANPSGVSDCIDKFDNILNLQAEPFLPGVDAVTKTPGVGS